MTLINQSDDENKSELDFFKVKYVTWFLRRVWKYKLLLLAEPNHSIKFQQSAHTKRQLSRSYRSSDLFAKKDATADSKKTSVSSVKHFFKRIQSE